MKFTRTTDVKPRQLFMRVVTFGIGLGILSAVGVSFPVALPWAIIIAICITFTFDE